MLFIEGRRTRDFKGRAAREAHPSEIKGVFLFFFFPPPTNIRPCIIQVTFYICTLPLKLESGMDVFGMLAHQSGIYVQLKIHILLPLNQCPKSLLVVVFSVTASLAVGDTDCVTQMFQLLYKLYV